MDGKFQSRNIGQDAFQAAAFHIAADHIVRAVGKGQSAQRDVTSGARAVDEYASMDGNILWCAIDHEVPGVAGGSLCRAHS